MTGAGPLLTVPRLSSSAACRGLCPPDRLVSLFTLELLNTCTPPRYRKL